LSFNPESNSWVEISLLQVQEKKKQAGVFSPLTTDNATNWKSSHKLKILSHKPEGGEWQST